MTDTEKVVIEAALEWAASDEHEGTNPSRLFRLLEACKAVMAERETAPRRVNPEPGRTKLTSAQRAFLTLLLREARGENEGIGSHSKYDYYFNTTQLRRLLPFVRANAHLIEELPRTPRGGWGYKLKDGVDPSKVVIP